MKGNDCLGPAILVYRKSIPVQVGHNALPVIHHGRMQHNFIDVFADDKSSVVLRLLLLAHGRRSCWGWRFLSWSLRRLRLGL